MDDSFNIGDTVKINPFYRTQYPEWADKDKPATVLSVKSWKVYAKNLGKEDRAFFQARYGILPEYNLFELMIEIEGTKYLVSQFGFSK
jgi:hypothetical protein